ncbi:MAG: alpha/beta fold hydrolase [Lewinellaceae bacterium]|nr:alpha/beta fold hydrolase [Lewinellaceae bacterium]
MKKKYILSLVSLILITTLAFPQADLAVTAASFQPSFVDRGEVFQVEVAVANFGNTTADANYLFIYYSPDLNISDEEIISRVSVKELAPNESQDIVFLYPISPSLSPGNYYIAFEVDPFNGVPESDESNLFCASNNSGCVRFNISGAVLNSQKFTYPILFVHGWTGRSETWNEFTGEATSYYGWSYGGRLDYCLNPDGDQSTSDGYYQSFVDISNLRVGDYYTVNFDISADGVLFVGNDGVPFNDDYSNQSAIVKQGWAVGDAIERVLDLTGAEKVILVGHSMGGLASREYLQNPENWQADGEHHVAKLLTIGTPNGGSNATGGALGGFIGFDEFSEAVRDLRYPSILFEGQYLFGGLENSISLYYNDDVDCNGTVGDLITGLNEKFTPVDVNYSCVLSPNDGVVALSRADLNNYLMATPPLAPPFADKFTVSSFHLNIHKENHSALIRGLDEPAFYDLAYPIPLNSLNYGFSTEQSETNPIPPPNNDVDWDDFVIKITQPGLLEVDIWNIPVQGFALFLLDDNYEVLREVQSFGRSNIGFDYQISPGTYYVEVGSIPDPDSWKYPYGYSVFFTPESGVVAGFSSNVQEGCAPLAVSFTDQSEGSPVSYSWSFPGGTPSTSTSANPTVTYSQPGVYPVTLTVTGSAGSNSITRDGYITVRATPEAAFSFDVQQNNTVAFTNQTQFEGETPEYLWDFGDGQMSSAISPSHTYADGGIYAVVLTATNSCGNSSASRAINIMVVSTTAAHQDTELLIFPNPTEDGLTVQIKGGDNGEYRLSIVNAMGQVVRQKEVSKTGEMVSAWFEVSGLPAGAYVVRVQSERGIWMGKVVKD